MLVFLKSLLFYPMMFLRGILKWGLKFLTGLFLILGIATLIAVYGFDTEKLQWFFPWTMLGSSFIIFLISWFYDIILLKINPHPDITLFLD